MANIKYAITLSYQGEGKTASSTLLLQTDNTWTTEESQPW